MFSFYVLAVACAVVFGGVVVGDASTSTPPIPSSSSTYPVFQPQATNGYIPHATYPYGDSYGPVAPNEAYFWPAYLPGSPYSTMSSLIPATQGAFHLVLKIFAKVGLFLIGGVALLLVGGVFTTAVCSLTPLCKITFSGFGGIDNETMRSFMTPEKLSTAAALVQDAIGKYQRLQRAVSK